MDLFVKNQDEFPAFAADLLLDLAVRAAAARGRFLLALSGGGTPEPVYRRLAGSPYLTEFPWDATHVFWGDERLVPPEHPENSWRQARKILLDRVPVPAEQIHPVNTRLPPAQAAREYAATLSRYAEPPGATPRLDAVLLGLGTDGHTASLFPGQEIADPGALAVPVTAEYGGRPARRVTLTPRTFNTARAVIFLAAGSEKAPALAAVLEGDPDPLRLPAQRIRPEHGQLVWIVDPAAASQLSGRVSPARR